MADRPKSHKDVEFAVDDATGRQRTFKKMDEAVMFAVGLAMSDGRPHNVDVLVYSAAGARWYGGDDGVQDYKADPEASVHDRIVIKAESKGRIA